MRAAWLLLLVPLALAGVAGIALASRSRWRESDPFAPLFLGVTAMIACLFNEILMGIVPMPWAVFYFPMRTVGLPMIAVFTGAFGLWRLAAGPGFSHRASSALAVMIAVGVILFCWRYRDMLFFDPREDPGGRGL